MNIKWDSNGLIPCIVQDSKTHEVLMLAYMNEEALELSLQTRIAHYYSRSKQRIWKKGETSGHIQEIQEILLDCDNDTILLRVAQRGAACHTGNATCFFKSIDLESKHCKQGLVMPQDLQQIEKYGVLDILYHTLLERKESNPNLSYTASLFAKGENAIAKKIIEESGEFCFAFKDKNLHEIIYECADVFYHIFVALADREIHPDRIYQELARRMGKSGIEEKKSRGLKKS